MKRTLLAPAILIVALALAPSYTLVGGESPANPPAIQPFEHSPGLFPTLPRDALHGRTATSTPQLTTRAK